ncbi:hypothetical protein B0J14DRAFT_610135 [Halenospora varia]|nr:hypothetical protein B0J14DRAFT_610135 [Halenospora varia]
MSDTLPIHKKKRNVEKQLAVIPPHPKRSSWTPSDDGASSSGSQSRLTPSVPADLGSIIVEFRLGLEPEELKEKDLIVLKRPTSKVVIVRHAATGLVMAKKVMSVEGQKSVRNKVIRELRVMHDCQSENILDFYAVFEDDKQNIVMCMEHMDVGSLDEIIKLGPIRVDVVGKIAVAILTGLNYLYTSHRIMHRDIQPSNVIVNSKGLIKLFNFGVSSELLNSIAETFVGSVGYMAPERINTAPYTIKSDVWAVGLTIIEAATSFFPFFAQYSNNDKRYPLSTLELLQHIVNEPSPRLPKSDAFPSMLHLFVKKCLMKDPKDRPSPQDLLVRDEFILAAKRTPVDLVGYLAEVVNDPKFRTSGNAAETVEATMSDTLEAYSRGIKSHSGLMPSNLFACWKDMMLMPLVPTNQNSAPLFTCIRCEQLLSELKTRILGRETIDDGVQKSCRLCQMILDCLPKADLSESSDPFNKTFPQSSPKPRNDTRIVLKIGQQSRLMDEVMRIGAQYQDRTTGSPRAFQMPGAWLHTCLTSHERCGKANNPSLMALLPSRVINVSISSDPGSVRLCTGSAQQGIYFTLSYRWNQTEDASFQTTTLKELQYKEAIRIEALPKVMQDAISITRIFGVQYLWIDALCIIQDSPDDWKREAKEMATIYKNSLLTIAVAADGNDNTQGCFRDRHRSQPRPLITHSLDPVGDTRYIFADRRMTKDGVRSPTELDTRAWVLQEQLLSPRVLTYSNEELYWDCKTLNASETFPNGIPGFYDADLQLPDERVFKEAILNTGNTTISQSRFYTSWMKIVEAYSERQMTKETDKLVALLGVVKEAAIVFEDSFIVGLWRKRLMSDLLWWVKSPDKSTRPSAFSAPSWSWVSLNAAISYGLGGFDAFDEINYCIKSYNVEAESNPTVAHLSGQLTVDGKLFPLRPKSHGDTHRSPDQTPEPSWMEDFEGTDTSQVECLIVAVSIHYIYALGLLPIEGQSGFYKRVGLVHWRANPERLGWDRVKGKWQASVEKAELKKIVIV